MMDRVRSNDQKEIPLFLLPQVIAKQIRTAGDRIYRISVKRTHWHHYNVSVRTKSLPRELAQGRTIVCEPEVLLPGRGGVTGGSQGGST